MVAISYDAPDVLKRFADSRGITFPLVSDPGSAIIKRYGLLNADEKPGTRSHGIPFPGTFIVDRKGIIRSRHFEEAYQERNTVASILTRRGAGAAGLALTIETAHLTLIAAVSDETVAPGERVSIVLDVTPRRGMHVYAPGAHSYRIIRITIDAQPWLRVAAPVYPPSQIYEFEPLKERVEVYLNPFRVTQDVVVVATPEAQKLLASRSSVTISGRVEYQACDDKVCYTPQSVPVSWTLGLKQLDRKPPD